MVLIVKVVIFMPRGPQTNGAWKRELKRVVFCGHNQSDVCGCKIVDTETIKK